VLSKTFIVAANKRQIARDTYTMLEEFTLVIFDGQENTDVSV